IGVTSDYERGMACLRSVAVLPMAAGISGRRRRSQIDGPFWAERGKFFGNLLVGESSGPNRLEPALSTCRRRLLSKRHDALREFNPFRARSAAHGGQRFPQQTSVQSGCAARKIRGGAVRTGVLHDARRGDPVGDGRRHYGPVVGAKVASGRFTPEHPCPTRYFPGL